MNKPFWFLVGSLFLVAAAADTQIDFTDEEFEDAAYYELFSEIGVFTETAPNGYAEGKAFYESHFRLVPGRITLYDISGNANAYVYIGYFGPGDTPTIESITSKSIDTYDERQQLTGKMMQSGDPTATYSEFCNTRFPELLYTDYIILGVNLDEAAYEYIRSTLPRIMLDRKPADEIAKEYFKSDDVEFVRYIWGSRVNGYEYSNGFENIIVPYDMIKQHWLPRPVYTREEIDAKIDDFKARDEDLDKYMREAYNRFWDRHRERIESGAE